MEYKEHKNLNYADVAAEMLAFWKKHHLFEKSVEKNKQNPFTFYEGPPSANGLPGIHHVMARTIKDTFCRYKTLKGYSVARKGGWDTHGLPVELQVEKELGITKEDIGIKISVEEYNQKCREAVMRYTQLWEDVTEKMGYWVDMQNPYITYQKDYIESLWFLLKKLHEKGLLYKGYTIQPYSPAAGTGLSSHELNQPGCYRNVKDTSLVAQFKIKGSFNDYILAWTTTPWTLPSNAALVVGTHITYVKVETHNQYTNQPINVILAKDAVSRIFTPDKYVPSSEFTDDKNVSKIPYTIIEQFKGDFLVGTEYEQLMPYVQPLTQQENAFKVIAGDFVTTEDGTGIVHCAPTFGADDYRAARQNNVPAILILDEHGKEMPLVDKRGRFVNEVTDFAGKFVKAEYEEKEISAAKDYKSTDVLIAIKLKEENKAFKVEKYEHNYPHCWRTDKPVLYYPLDSWFIRTTALKERMVELNKTINWKPASTGEGRFGNWLENLVDWNLSRSRYWGTPLPIWASEDYTETLCIGSIAELTQLVLEANEKGILTAEEIKKNQEVITLFAQKDGDIHRPYVDWITLVSASGKKMKRETDLVDVWFDSGAMPYAQWHYPFENQEVFQTNFPADFIAEGVDQTRGWFFTLHALGVLLFDSVAFKNVVSNGLVLDKDGNKMSKSKGNVVNPFDTLAKYGADPVRWYMIENCPPWENLKFNLEGIAEVQRKFFGTLQNTYSFFALYANLDHFEYKASERISVEKRSESDRWIISKLNSLIQLVDKHFEEYDPTPAVRAIQEFVNDDLSNWYVRLNRKRFWKSEYNEDKKAAYQTLFECLRTVAILAAPVAPFYMDFLYRNLLKVGENEATSVHLADFPVVETTAIHTTLERRMELAQTISSLVHSLRKKQNIRVRQPLQKILVPILEKTTQEHIEAVADLIKTEVNIKEINFIGEDADILVKKIKPNFRKIGKTHGKYMKEITAVTEQMSQKDIQQLEKTNAFNVNFADGSSMTLTTEDVEITSQDIQGLLVATERSVTVALDITLTQELLQEGIARDLVNRIQNLRKDQNLDVQDKIHIRLQKGAEVFNAAVSAHKNYICDETQALSLDIVDILTNGTEIEIEDHKVVLEMTV